MFSPKSRDLERGWPGRIEGDRVIHLAAQTLQSYFTGGGAAREHDDYLRADVELRAPVLHPPSVRVFSSDGDFWFANPAAIRGRGAAVALPDGADWLESELRLAAVIGADQAVGGFTLMNDWLAPELPGAKARDFAISLGPVLVTPEEVAARDDWNALVEHARRNTRLLPGDVIAAGGVRDGPHRPGDTVELEVEGIGILRSYVAAAS